MQIKGQIVTRSKAIYKLGKSKTDKQTDKNNENQRNKLTYIIERADIKYKKNICNITPKQFIKIRRLHLE